MKKYFVLNMPPWGRRVMVVFGLSKKDTLIAIRKNRFMRIIYNKVETDKRFDDIEGQDEAYTYFDKEHGLFFMYIYSWKDDDDHKEFLVHDVAHIVKDMLTYIGAQKEDEATGYTNGWLWRKLVKRLNRITGQTTTRQTKKLK